MFSYQSLSVCGVSLPTSVYEILVATVFWFHDGCKHI